MFRRKLNVPSQSRPTGLVLAFVLSITLLLVSCARLAADLGSTAFNADIVHSSVSEPLWRTRLGFNTALFALALTVLHLAFGLLCWLGARICEYAFPHSSCSRRNWILVWHLAGVIWILLANATYFPHSALGSPYRNFVNFRIFGLDMSVLVAIALLACVAALLLVALRRRATPRFILTSAGLAILAGATGLSSEMMQSGNSRSEAPNIIILGVDSLRPDAINATTTPNLQGFMVGAVQWSDAITPLARTFPSWVSILTGRHPHTTGAYMNLLRREQIRTGDTLPAILREQGYRTIYAIDETRFSNIDASYGFDHVVTPAMGGSDFLLTRIADTPLSNLVMNTRIGAWLFPHIHANRAADVVYNPDSFVQRLHRELVFTQPSFLAIHLTLPHWPYTWATSDNDRYTNSTDELYHAALRRVDKQFGDVLALLERRGLLDNALVITLSDHGEALGHEDDFLAEAFPFKDKEVTEYQRWGHGTSVFSPHQYRVTLGFRAYGTKLRIGAVGARNEPVSLVDLAPTLLDLLNIAPAEPYDGISLAPLLRPGASARQEVTDRIRFTESEYNPQGFDPRAFSRSQLAAASRIYQLDASTDRITVRTDLLDSIMATRQYAALLGNRAMAAAIPGFRNDGRYDFVYVTDKRYEVGHNSDDPQRLRAALEQRFGIDIAESPEHSSAADPQHDPSLGSGRVTARRSSSATSVRSSEEAAHPPRATVPSMDH
jgi:arylsulfatase A-like enzyme